MPFSRYQEATGSDLSQSFFESPTPPIALDAKLPSHLHRFWGLYHSNMDTQRLSYDYWGLPPIHIRTADKATKLP